MRFIPLKGVLLSVAIAAYMVSAPLLVKAQAKCGLAVAGYVDADSTFNGKIGIVRKGLLSGISAYAQEWDSKVRYDSVPSGNLRYFGDMAEGDYRIYVGKSGYKTTIYGVRLECRAAMHNGIFIESIRLWKGASSRFVNNATTRPHPIKEMRLDRMTKLGSSDSDTGSQMYSPGSSSPRSAAKVISAGILNGKATVLPKPAYPDAAKALRVGGSVSVQVLIDESGHVVSASAVSGHPLLTGAAEVAARAAIFGPTLLDGKPVKVSGVITYNFIAQ